MKKLISLLSIISLFSLAIACNQDRQDEEVRGMETTDERMEGDAGLGTGEDMDSDQRMEDDFQENYDQIEQQDTQGTEGRTEESVNQ
ncbi:MAG TPA: hypothetical protein VKY27_04135 [Bacteriovoracaceae bacterium]|nr:hypothetical protein [Bacteriovoracaceae bacterium]HLW56549.1 hypothetical protein [Bacteriovoracaceae bacterium]